MKLLQLFMLALVSHFAVQNSFAQTATANCNTNYNSFKHPVLSDRIFCERRV